MALDGFDKGNPEVVDQIATEAFLRGCRDKEAARSVFEKDPSSITQAVKMVKAYIANQRAISPIQAPILCLNICASLLSRHCIPH
jgi:hypothetical protein